MDKKRGIVQRLSRWTIRDWAAVIFIAFAAIAALAAVVVCIYFISPFSFRLTCGLPILLLFVAVICLLVVAQLFFGDVPHDDDTHR